MAIRFPCTGCGQMLSIASRKAGTEVACPKCAAKQRVPSGEVSTAGDSGGAPGGGGLGGPGAADGRDSDSDPVLAPPAGPRPRPAAGPGPVAPVSPPSAAAPPAGMVLLSRRAIYVQGGLFVLVGLLAFAAGYLVGRAGGPAPSPSAERSSGRQPVLLEGTLVYHPGGGGAAGDEGAVVIVLPETASWESPLPVRGIRPIDAELTDTEATVEQIESHGGAYARASSSGAFSLVLPRPGRYRVLAISAHAQRPAEVRIDELDLEELGQCLDRPEYLIGPFQYCWTPLEIRPGAPRWDHDFGPSGPS